MIKRILKNEFGEIVIPPYKVMPNKRYMTKLYPWVVTTDIGRTVAFARDEITAHKWVEQLESTGYIDVLGG